MQRYGQYPLQWGQFGNNGLGLNGLTLQEGVGYVPPLDGLPTAFAAVGLCKLLTSYSGPLVRLRRSTDNVEADFSALSSGWLDPVAIAAWRGAGDAFVVTRYDQTGNTRHVTQSTAANQAKLATHCRSVICDGTNDAALMASSTDWGRNVAGLTGASVARYISKVANNCLWQTNTPTPNNRFRVITVATSGAGALQSRRLDADAGQSFNTPSDIGDVWHRMIGRRDYAAALGTLKIDGVDLSSALGTAGSTSDTSSPTAVFVESSPTGSDFWNGETSAHVWFQTALSDADMTRLDAGLAKITAEVMTVWTAP